MKEQLISFQTAKLAKEKGFTNIFDTFDLVKMFRENKDGSIESDNELQGNERDHYYLRPTQSLLQKWLREVHKIQIDIRTDWNSGIGDHGDFFFQISIWNKWDDDIRFEQYNTYEEALEIGLKDALNIIK